MQGIGVRLPAIVNAGKDLILIEQSAKSSCFASHLQPGLSSRLAIYMHPRDREMARHHAAAAEMDIVLRRSTQAQVELAPASGDAAPGQQLSCVPRIQREEQRGRCIGVSYKALSGQPEGGFVCNPLAAADACAARVTAVLTLQTYVLVSYRVFPYPAPVLIRTSLTSPQAIAHRPHGAVAAGESLRLSSFVQRGGWRRSGAAPRARAADTGARAALQKRARRVDRCLCRLSQNVVADAGRVGNGMKQHNFNIKGYLLRLFCHRTPVGRH